MTIFEKYNTNWANLKCDFCSGQPVTWSYPVESFRRTQLASDGSVHVTGSDGWWAACDECHVMISSGDHYALQNRSYRTFVALNHAQPKSAERRLIVDQIHNLHNQFWKHRTGDPVPIDEIANDPAKRAQAEGRIRHD